MYEVVVWPLKKGQASWDELSFFGNVALQAGIQYFDAEAKKGKIPGFQTIHVYDSFYISAKMLRHFCEHMENEVGVTPTLVGSRLPKPDIKRWGDYKVLLSDI